MYLNPVLKFLLNMLHFTMSVCIFLSCHICCMSLFLLFNVLFNFLIDYFTSILLNILDNFVVSFTVYMRYIHSFGFCVSSSEIYWNTPYGEHNCRDMIARYSWECYLHCKETSWEIFVQQGRMCWQQCASLSESVEISKERCVTAVRIASHTMQHLTHFMWL